MISVDFCRFMSDFCTSALTLSDEHGLSVIITRLLFGNSLTVIFLSAKTRKTRKFVKQL